MCENMEEEGEERLQTRGGGGDEKMTERGKKFEVSVNQFLIPRPKTNP